MMRRGHTLNELMVAISLSMVLMALIFGISVNMQKVTEEVNRRTDQNSGAQAAIDLLRSDVELAGHRWGGGTIVRPNGFPAGFCSVNAQAVPDVPVVGIVPGHQQLVLRGDRFPSQIEGFRVGQTNQVPDGRIEGADEEVVYVFERTSQPKNLWRLRRAYRTGENDDWQCLTLLENIVLPRDGAPFRYDVLVQRGGERVVDRNLRLQNPVLEDAVAPMGGRVQNDLFEMTGDGSVDLADFLALTNGSILAGLHMRFCLSDGRVPRHLGHFECEPDNMRESSPNLRLIEVGIAAKNVMTWRSYVEGRTG